MAYVTLDTVKNFLGISDTSQDAYLSQLIDYATSLVDNFVGRNLELATHIEFLDINFNAYARYVHLKFQPVVDVLEVVLSDRVLQATEFEVYRWGLYLRTIEYGAKILKVTYNGGYNPIPKEIEFVTLNLVSDLYKLGSSHALPKSERIGSVSMTFEKTLSKEQVLEPYKNILLKYKPVF